MTAEQVVLLWLAAIILLCTACGLGAAAIASRKGLSRGGYFLLGLLLGLLGIAVALIAQPRVAPARAGRVSKRCIHSGCPVQAMPGRMVCHRHRGDR